LANLEVMHALCKETQYGNRRSWSGLLQYRTAAKEQGFAFFFVPSSKTLSHHQRAVSECVAASATLGQTQAVMAPNPMGKESTGDASSHWATKGSTILHKSFRTKTFCPQWWNSAQQKTTIVGYSDWICIYKIEMMTIFKIHPFTNSKYPTTVNEIICKTEVEQVTI